MRLRKSTIALLAMATAALTAGTLAAAPPGAAITGGAPVSESVFPSRWAFTVALALPADGALEFHCTGALVAPTLVVTAAHCLDLEPFGLGAADLVAVVGASNWATSGTRHAVAAATVDTAEDVAVLTLSTATSAPTVALPAAGGTPAASLTAGFAGWGLASATGANPTVPASLQEAQAVVSSVEDGRLLWTSDGIPSTCSGDSGGPLVATIDGVRTLIGVASLADPSCTSFSAWSNLFGSAGDLVRTAVSNAGGGGGGVGGNHKPVLGYTATPREGAAPLTVTFNLSSSTDPDGDPLVYLVDPGFGDFLVGTDPVFQITYTQDGEYIATVAVIDPSDEFALEFFSVKVGGDGGGGGGGGGGDSTTAEFFVSADTVDFGVVSVDLTSTQQITIENISGAAATPAPAVSTSLPYTVSGCEDALAPFSYCVLDITFAPTAEGDFDGDLGLTLGGVPYPVSVTGTGILPFTVTPTSLDFGAVGLGVTSPVQTVTVQNDSGMDLEPQWATAQGSDWSVTAVDCPTGTTMLAAEASCDLQVSFTPSALGPAASDLGLTLRGRHYPVGLTAAGVGAITVTPASVDFGPVDVDSADSAELTITNTSRQPLPLGDLATGFSPSGPFSITPGGNAPCESADTEWVLATDAYCTMVVDFTPTTPGPVSSTLTLSTHGHEYTVPVSGSAPDDDTGWTLTGFYRPVDVDGIVNTVKAGSTVPLKFEVFRGDTELTDVSAVTSFTPALILCETGAATDAIESVSTGGTTLRYDATAGQFIQKWQTPKKPGTCYRVTITTQDGSELTALFKLK